MQKGKRLHNIPSTAGFLLRELRTLHMHKCGYITDHPVIISLCKKFNTKMFWTSSRFEAIWKDRVHYDVITAGYGEKADLLFADTDSLMDHIETPDIYKHLVEMKEHFDLSNFHPTKNLLSTGPPGELVCCGEDEWCGGRLSDVWLRWSTDKNVLIRGGPDQGICEMRVISQASREWAPTGRVRALPRPAVSRSTSQPDWEICAQSSTLL